MKYDLTLPLHSKLIKFSLLVLYCILLFVTLYHHEIWRDEADPWLLARDVSSFSEFIFYARNSGHPLLWHLSILPFAKLGLSYHFMQGLNAIFAILNVILLLYKSNLPRIILIPIVFSYFLLFEYAVIARNYSIGVLFLFLIAIHYPKRFSNPILYGSFVFLLCNTSAFSSMIASGLFILYSLEIYENERYEKNIFIGLFIIMLGGLLAFLQMLPTGGGQEIHYFRNNIHFSIPFLMTNSFTPYFAEYYSVIGYLLILVLMLKIFKNRNLFIFFAYTLTVFFLFVSFIHIGGVRHTGQLFLLVLFTFWISIHYDFESKEDDRSIVFLNREYNLNAIFILGFLGSLLFSVYSAFDKMNKDYHYAFSGAKEIASYLKEKGYDDPKYKMAAHIPERCKVILIYLDRTKQFYYPFFRSFGSYSKWDRDHSQSERFLPTVMSSSLAIPFIQPNGNMVYELFNDLEPNTILIMDTEIQPPIPFLQLIYKNTIPIEFYKEETFFVYLVKK
jgi:hypothetical protein